MGPDRLDAWALGWVDFDEMVWVVKMSNKQALSSTWMRVLIFTWVILIPIVYFMPLVIGFLSQENAATSWPRWPIFLWAVITWGGAVLVKRWNGGND